MIFTRIQSKYNTLTRVEKRIAEEVQKNPDRVVKMTAKELAKECDTVASAVIRFCKSIDVGGFSELKIELAKSIGIQSKDDVLQMPPVVFGDKVENIFAKVFDSSIKTLEDTLKKIDYDKVEKIAQILKRAKRVYFMGVGTSSIIATDAQYRFAQLGLNSVACTDVVFMNVNATNVNVDDVVVAISHSGRTRTVVDAMRIAKKSGATTVAISSFEDSPLAKESDYAVTVHADEENYPIEAVSARLAHVCVIDAFMMTIASLDENSFEKHVIRRNNILRDIRY